MADRGALLQQIQQGKRLRKAVTNDRSAPKVATNPSSGGGGMMGMGGGAPPSLRKAPGGGGSGGSPAPASGPPAPVGPQLGNLFAGGMPKLRSRGGVATGRGTSGAQASPPPPRPPPAPPLSAGPRLPSRGGPPRPPPVSLPAQPPPPPPPPPPATNQRHQPFGARAPSPPPPPSAPATNRQSSTFGGRRAPPPPPPLPSANRRPGAPPGQSPMAAVTAQIANRNSMSPPKSSPPGFRLPVPPRPPNGRSSFSPTPSGPNVPIREGRWTFHHPDEFPPPGGTASSTGPKHYPSGRSSGSSIPLRL